ncbi:GNAT family N-acetyltransferase [Streptomyces sp. YIM S03343]
MNENFALRPMRLGDCERVAEIRVRGWQSAYRGLIPQPYLDALSVAVDAERHRERLGRAEGAGVDLVAESGGQVVGWACHGPCRDDDTGTGDAELYAIYVAPDRLGTGAGRALLTECVRQSAAGGRARMFLWVVKENTRARRFYERAGFRADGAEEPFEAGGVEIPEVRYVAELADGAPE